MINYKSFYIIKLVQHNYYNVLLNYRKTKKIYNYNALRKVSILKIDCPFIFYYMTVTVAVELFLQVARGNVETIDTRRRFTYQGI